MMTDREIYVKLLTLDNGARGKIQDVLCTLRDRIAEDEQISEEDVQNTCEQMALRSRYPFAKQSTDPLWMLVDGEWK